MCQGKSCLTKHDDLKAHGLEQIRKQIFQTSYQLLIYLLTFTYTQWQLYDLHLNLFA